MLSITMFWIWIYGIDLHSNLRSK